MDYAHYLATLDDGTALEAFSDDSAQLETAATLAGATKTEAKAARSALDKARRGDALTRPERIALEAIIIPGKRPAVLIQDGAYRIEHPDWLALNDAAAVASLSPAIGAVGRIDLTGHPGLPYAGTGFVVGEGLVMTNRHVAELFADGRGRDIAFRPGLTAALDLVAEEDRPAGDALRVAEVLPMVHPHWDMALLRVEGLDVAPMTLSAAPFGDLFGRTVAVIGYPAFDPNVPSEVIHKVFKGIYNVKRLQPGRLRGLEPVLGVQAGTHDASTLGGNSGSAVVDVATGEVLALHFAGAYLKTNYAVPAGELAQDPKVRDAGVRFAGAAPGGADPGWLGAWAATETTPAPAPGNDQPSPALQSAAPDGATWTIPIEVTVRVGGRGPDARPVVAAAAAPAPVPALEKMVEPVHQADYGTRQGYDPDFLGPRVPLPTVRAADLPKLAKTAAGEHVLPYHHFSLAMHAGRRLAVWTAANVDAMRTEPEPGRAYDRKSLNGFTSDNDREKWFTDPRIPADAQLPDRFFTKDRTAFDKGHIVRRNAIAWGDSFAEVQNANGDSFHVTNCSPQVKGFNRSNLGGLWGRLENAVLKNAGAERLCVLAGPVLREDDPVFAGVDDEGAVQVRIPRAYWKVICAAGPAGPETHAFVLDQDLGDVAFEFALAQEWRERQVALRAVEDLLGSVVFDDALHAGDTAGR